MRGTSDAAKIERGHRMDLMDVREMVKRDLIRVEALARRFEAIAPLLLRYPAIDPDAFRAKVERFIQGVDDARAR